MKIRKSILFYISMLPLLLGACSSGTPQFLDNGNYPIVEVNGKVLYKEEIEEIVPSTLNSTDSTLAAETYIKMWIKNELMYEKAEDNLLNKKEIDELVENYKQSLIIYTYQEQLLKERLSKNITDRELKAYYDENTEQFVLRTNLIKGLFLKVPQTSPQLDNLRKWYKSTTDEALENIEKYSLQNAVIYDYFYNDWVDFEDVMNNIPYSISNPETFLKQQKNLETQDSTYVYLLNIKEYSLQGNTAPFEYVKGQLTDILLNLKREDFIKNFEEELYDNAIRSKKITYYTD